MSEREDLIAELPDNLRHAAQELVIIGNVTGMLCAPACEDALKYPSDQKSPEQLAPLILDLAKKIGESIAAALTREYPEIPDPRRVAAANEVLNQSVGNPMNPADYTSVEAGQIDQFTQNLTIASQKIRAIYEKVLSSAPDFTYVFDLNLNENPRQTMARDIEDLLDHMGTMHEFTKRLLRIILEQQAGDLKVNFEARESAYRSDMKLRHGLQISALLSNAKLLRDDFEHITNQLRATTQAPEFRLAAELIVHYFFTAETFSDPLGRANDIIKVERDFPGEVGIEYLQRLERFLDVYKRTITAMNMLQRTLLLLECRL